VWDAAQLLQSLDVSLDNLGGNPKRIQAILNFGN